MMENEEIELVDVVDENNRVIGETPRKGIHKTSNPPLHRASHIFMFDSKGRLWIEKRGPSVDTNPGYYDSSAAGHVRKGESYLEGAEREVIEELGIEGLDLKPVHMLKAGPNTMNEFVQLFITNSDRLPRLHEDAASQECYTIEEIDEKMSRGERFTPIFRACFSWYKSQL